MPRLYVSGVDGFFPREFSGDHSWRWMADRGSMAVVNRLAEPFDGTLEAELESFAAPRTADITVDDRPVMRVTVGRDRRWLAIAPLRIPAGLHVVAFRAATTRVSDVTPGTRDDRRLSIRLGRWRWLPDGPT
jgi:hypothetical protein